MQAAVEETMDKLTTGTDYEVRRLSEGFGLDWTIADVTVRRRETISALRSRNKAYKERKSTMKVI